jgi:AcrR family transcriptional regulator
MPRDAEKVRRRLQEAALKLFEERGYEQITAADIAAEAGVTQRTFFRHFPDKREVLFSGEDKFIGALTQAVSSAPPSFGPWEALRYALRSVEPVFVENRAFSMPRQRIIAGHPALQERAQTKLRAVMTALTTALRERGVADRPAKLAAQMGMAAMNQAVSTWFKSESTDLGSHIEQAFEDVRELSSAAPAANASEFG